ncbi:hypothetical protein PFICI_09503 [Pestalotiopsis fici W106-1]|uniref:Zn(2)-C6 fungal-type domain-containing protein n=1 Tax=Pestalotiopsis fici (strain W106-1 / CGMCC3.15140) TaxID=1229662 RepID=W3X0M8_PESFW|nr:uncharacterized protein PFICI_09503 [Pestalotiopsis fici W106-1]ETS79650.1 hypothetical protein PFICI_09503 [Pestalotiopsis fici W106-1]
MSSPGSNRNASRANSLGSPPAHRRGLKRSAAACERCRRRKQKCDGKLPICGPCGSARAICVPSERLVVRPDFCSHCVGLREKVARLEAEVQALESRSLNEHQNGDGDSQQHLGYTSSEGQSISAAPCRSLDIAYTGRILRPTFASRLNGQEVDDAFKSSPWHLWRDDPTTAATPGLAEQTAWPLDAHASKLIDIFFARRWPSLPILHQPTFRQRHYEPLLNGKPAKDLSHFQVYMVLAIAGAEAPSANRSQTLSHQDFFQIAIRDLHLILNADDLECIQCLLLLCMYGSNEPQSVNMWYTSGLALRLAIGIDLHRAETTSKLDLLHAEMSKRIFWCAYVMDRSMAIAMGRPLGIQDTDITTPLPLQLSDSQLMELSEGPVMGNLVAQSDDMSTFIHVSKLRRLNGEIYKSFHAPVISGMADVALDTVRSGYLSRLNDWIAASPRYLPTASMFQSPEWFQIAYHQAVLSLYRPSRGAPMSSIDSLRLCMDSAISMVGCYNALYAKNKIVYTFLALNSVFMAAVTILYCIRASSAIRDELSKSVAEANISSAVRLLQSLSSGRSVGSRCTEIIERLSSAVLTVFDQPVQSEELVDAEFLSWFGLKFLSVRPDEGFRAEDMGVPAQPTPNFDIPWNDLMDAGYEMINTTYMDMLF